MEFFTEETLNHTTQQHQNWRVAIKVLRSVPSRFMLDEAVETNARYKLEKCQSWAGIFHTPPNSHLYSPFSHKTFFQEEYWQESGGTMQIAFALSEYSAKNLRKHLTVPVVKVYHPAHFPHITFDPEAYLRNPHKAIHQLGWVFRNTQAIYQLPPIKHHTKTFSTPTSTGAIRNVNSSIKYWEENGGRQIKDNQVKQLAPMSDSAYDLWLSRNIMFMEVFDASANNAVLDCIARNTPLVVNRHPALEEYLGKEYPLFFDKFEGAEKLFDTEKLLEGYHYLQEMDKEKFTGLYFRICMNRELEMIEFGDR